MKSKGSDGPRTADRYARATALVRALTGVLDAHLEADATGIRTILVTADPGSSAWEVTRNVQSALLASLGLAVDRAAVRVCRPEEPDRPAAQSPPPAEAAAALHNGVAPYANGKSNGSLNGSLNGHGHARPQGGSAPAVPQPSRLAPPRPTLPASPARSSGSGSVARLELEARTGGRIACRVVVALADRIAAGQAEGEDTPRGRAETAARAVIAAAPAAGAELDGIRPVELGGRYYVVVAVRSWTGREVRTRAGVAAQETSPEAAAARAALNALLS